MSMKLTPAAATSTTISPGPGRGAARSATLSTSGPPRRSPTTTRIVALSLPDTSGPAWHRTGPPIRPRDTAEWSHVCPGNRPVPGCSGGAEAHHAGPIAADDPRYPSRSRAGDLVRPAGFQDPGKDNRRVRRVQEPSKLLAAQRLGLSRAWR